MTDESLNREEYEVLWNLFIIHENFYEKTRTRLPIPDHYSMYGHSSRPDHILMIVDVTIYYVKWHHKTKKIIVMWRYISWSG